jgi:hypothetical protein
MFTRSLASIGAALAFVAASSAGAMAGGYHHTAKVYHHAPPAASRACYKKVRTPDVFKTVRVKVMVQPSSCHTVRDPARYTWTQRPVVIKPERVIHHQTPAVYRIVAVNQMVQPAQTVWKHKRWHGSTYMCRENQPAVYRTAHSRVMVTPPAVRAQVIPARVRMVDQRVMVHPGSARQICRPPVYQWVDQRVLVHHGKDVWQPVVGGPPC